MSSAAPNYRVAGEVVIPGGSSRIKGRYIEIANRFIGKIISSSKKKRRVLGSYDPSTSSFNFKLRATRQRTVNFRCSFTTEQPPSPKPRIPGALAGTWVINDNVIMISRLLEDGSTGEISGHGLFGIKNFTLSGVHVSADDIQIVLTDPSGFPDTEYTLRLCKSGNTMIGYTNEQLFDNTSVWCRKPAGFDDDTAVCPDDATCPYDPYGEQE